MKKILLLLTVFVSFAFTMKTNAQTTLSDPASCPIITNFQIVPQGPGNWKVQFNYQNPTSGNKWVSVEAKCNSTTVLSPSGLNCFQVPTDNSAPLYTSATFACSSIANLTITVRSHTGNNCGGAVCQQQRSIAGSPLPVVFKSFSASRNRSNVSLTWVTSTEENNTGFQLQRRIGVANWETLSFIPTKAINGNSSSDLSYSYSDLNATTGMSQYRLMQVDLDGKTKYSETRAVYGEGQGIKLTVYPNPTNDGNVKVVFDSGNAIRDISVMDMSGRIVKQMKGITNNNFEITGLVPGMYNLRVINRETGEQSLEKIVVNK